MLACLRYQVVRWGCPQLPDDRNLKIAWNLSFSGNDSIINSVSELVCRNRAITNSVWYVLIVACSITSEFRASGQPGLSLLVSPGLNPAMETPKWSCWGILRRHFVHSCIFQKYSGICSFLSTRITVITACQGCWDFVMEYWDSIRLYVCSWKPDRLISHFTAQLAASHVTCCLEKTIRVDRRQHISWYKISTHVKPWTIIGRLQSSAHLEVQFSKYSTIKGHDVLIQVSWMICQLWWHCKAVGPYWIACNLEELIQHPQIDWHTDSSFRNLGIS